MRLIKLLLISIAALAPLFATSVSASTPASSRSAASASLKATTAQVRPTHPELNFPLRLHRDQISVSGISSGAFMAVQLHIAHAESIRGIASIAGGIWNCAEGDLQRSQDVCLKQPEKVDVAALEQLYRSQLQSGKLAANSYLNARDNRIWIFASAKDQVTRPVAGDKLAEFYKSVAPLAQIQRAQHADAAHGFLTETYGKPCGQHGLPWIIDCDHDQAGELLAAIVQPRPAKWNSRQSTISQNYFRVAQNAPPDAMMLDWAEVYVPTACQAATGKTCALHVALHGCQMSTEFIQRQFIEHAGYNAWAEANDIVILYPQVAKSRTNPLGCWDWFGYTQKDHVSRDAPQIRALQKLIQAL